MTAYRFQIHNRDALRSERTLVPFARYISRLLTSSGVVRELCHDSTPPNDGWLVFQGNAGSGFGVRFDYEGGPLSPLQRSLELVRCAHALVKGFGGPRSFPCTFSLRATLPESWRVLKVVGVVNTIWCGSSIPALEPPARGVGEVRDPKVRTKLVAFLSGVSEVRAGERVELEKLLLQLPEVGIVGCGYMRGGDMTIEVEERGDACEQRVPGVRLDLGEIEVLLSDLVSLRPGAVLDLGGATLERCFVRLGSTILAEGRFSTCDGKLTLTIETVM